VKELIQDEKVPFKIAMRATNLSKATYYYHPVKDVDLRKRPLDGELVTLLKALPKYEQTYGYRKITVLFDKYNHKKIYRHMKQLAITQPRKLKKRRKNRLDISCPIKSNIRWEGDLTYVFDGSKLNYLFAIVDAYDKEPIGDYYGLRCRADEAIHSLEDAVRTRFGSLEPFDGYRVTLRIDQGSQYLSKKFRKRANELGVHLEYCGINCPNDKPYIECFFSKYKCEEVYRNEYRSFTDAFLGWLEYKKWYMSKRIHQGLGWVSIPEFKNIRNSHLAGTFQS